MALLIGGGEHPVGGDAAEGVLIHKGAVVGLEIALQIGVITAGPPGAVQGVQLKLEIRLVQGGHGVAGLLGGMAEHGHLGQLVDALFQQVVPPGLALLLVVHLVGGVRIGVKGGGPHHSAVVGVDIGLLVVVLDHRGAEVLPVDGDRGGALLEEAAVPHQKGDGQHGDHAAHNTVQDVLAAVLIRRSVISALDIGGVRALFVVFGCTHSWFRPLIISQIGRSGRRALPARYWAGRREKGSGRSTDCIIQERFGGFKWERGRAASFYILFMGRGNKKRPRLMPRPRSK